MIESFIIAWILKSCVTFTALFVLLVLIVITGKSQYPKSSPWVVLITPKNMCLAALFAIITAAASLGS